MNTLAEFFKPGAKRALMEHNILAYPYGAERPVAVLGAKNGWARQAALIWKAFVFPDGGPTLIYQGYSV